jgi:hypothetical protein
MDPWLTAHLAYRLERLQVTRRREYATCVERLRSYPRHAAACYSLRIMTPTLMNALDPPRQHTSSGAHHGLALGKQL